MTQAGVRLVGMCYSEGCLYVLGGLEGRGGYTLILTVYSVQSDSGQLTRLDTMTGLGGGWPSLCPRVDHHRHRVFVPCYGTGVTVAHLDGDRLVREGTRTCVMHAICVDVMSPDTVYVGDIDSRTVHVVDIKDDRKIMTLEKPDRVREPPWSLAVLGDSIMVCYGDSDPTLVVYRHSSPTPVRVVPRLSGLGEVAAVSTDCRSNFIVTDKVTRSVFIIDADGNLRHTINIPYPDSDTDSRSVGCAVVNRQLWLGCVNGDIVIMS